MKSPHQSSSSPSLLEVRRPDPIKAAVRNSDQADDRTRDQKAKAEALAAAMFSAALDSAGVTRDEAAYLMGVSRSMVDKMAAGSKTPSLVQLLLLPPHFHLALIRELDRHYGLGRSVLAQVQQAVGTLSLLVR